MNTQSKNISYIGNNYSFTNTLNNVWFCDHKGINRFYSELLWKPETLNQFFMRWINSITRTLEGEQLKSYQKDWSKLYELFLDKGKDCRDVWYIDETDNTHKKCLWNDFHMPGTTYYFTFAENIDSLLHGQTTQSFFASKIDLTVKQRMQKAIQLGNKAKANTTNI